MKFALTAKGQMTIPKDIRDHLNLRPGDRANWFVDHRGMVFLLPERSITELKGIFKGRRKRLELEEIDQAVTAEAVARDKRSRRRP